MEGVLPCLIGILSAYALWLGTGAFSGDVAVLPRERPYAGVVSSLLSLGPVGRLVETRAIVAASDALAAMPWKGALPFEHAEKRERGLSVLGACCVCGMLGVAVSLSLFGLVASVLPAALLCALRAADARKRLRELETAMPEAFGSLAISLGTGYSLPQAMRFVGAHSREPVRSEFMRVSFAVDCGESAARALDVMLGRLNAPGLELVVLALKVSQRTGAPLGDLLTEAADLCRERLELRRALDVKTSQARMSARMVAGMPVAMIALLTLLSTDFRAGLATATGVVSIAVALALNAVAWAAIKKIMDVEV